MTTNNKTPSGYPTIQVIGSAGHSPFILNGWKSHSGFSGLLKIGADPAIVVAIAVSVKDQKRIIACTSDQQSKNSPRVCALECLADGSVIGKTGITSVNARLTIASASIPDFQAILKQAAPSEQPPSSGPSI